MRNVPLIFLDTETTSLVPGVRKTWEIGIIKEYPDGSTTSLLFQLPVTAQHIMTEADPRSLEICNFYARSHKVTQEELKANLKKMDELFSDRPIVVGMVPDFDALNLMRLLYWSSPAPWYYQLLDVDILGAGIFLAKGFDVDLPFHTEQATVYLDVIITEDMRHTALGDALWTKEFYHALLKFAKSSAVGTEEDHKTLLVRNLL